MTYVIAKHKKTGSEQIFTEPVFRANESKGWKFIAYTENPNAKKKSATTAASTGAETKTEVKEVKKETAKQPAAADVADSVLTDLQSQYKVLTGKEAKKNWGVPRLTEEIKKVENKA